jgi:hypothetical protein
MRICGKLHELTATYPVITNLEQAADKGVEWYR